MTALAIELVPDQAADRVERDQLGAGCVEQDGAFAGHVEHDVVGPPRASCSPTRGCRKPKSCSRRCSRDSPEPQAAAC